MILPARSSAAVHRPVRVLLRLQGQGVEPVGGEVVLLLALLGDGDIGDEGVDLAGVDRTKFCAQSAALVSTFEPSTSAIR